MTARITAGPLIPEFYSGRTVFITGATGFLGKVLLNRLLSTCPEIKRLLLLVRTKKDMTPEKRLQELKQCQIFEDISRDNPKLLDKMTVIPGNTSLPRLGISDDHMPMLDEVSIVFNSAATIKFDEPLPVAVTQNVRSVMELLQICDTLPRLDAFIQVSTGYSNCDLTVIEEKVYPAPVTPEQLLAAVDALPADLLDEITMKFIAPKPNTYCFTKTIAENIVQRHAATKRRYSMAIFRPTIVVSAMQNPYPGWVEGLNGAAAVVVACGKGLLHVIPSRPDLKQDYLPVDIAIDTLIAIGWETVLDGCSNLKVYNCSTCENPMKLSDFEQQVRFNLRNHPLDSIIWYPTAVIVDNKYGIKFLEFVLQTLPMHFVGYGCQLLGLKIKMNPIAIEQRIRHMTKSFAFFLTNEFKFKTNNIQNLRSRLTPEDAEIYNLDVHTINWNDHNRNFVIGARKYLLREKDENLIKAKAHLRRMRMLHYGMMFLCFLLLVKIAVSSFSAIVY